MIIGVVIKQPSEILDFDVDCTSLFKGDSDYIDSVQVSWTPETVGFDVQAVVADENTIKVWIYNGTAGDEHSVAVKIISAGGRVKEDEIRVKIQEFV